MQRETKTSAEIRDEVDMMIRRALQARGCEESVVVGEPKYLASPDISGCNWYLDYISNAHAHLFDVGTALATVKRKWNLPARHKVS